ncbi:MAG: zf-HC2 domain-containing protein [Thermoanaerobacterales bacterium]|nr:zf-HC2 domain-containing protein [Thermoanaerobacterales bacterium]
MCHDKGTLMAYVDGELTPADALGVVDHLNSCSRCREEEAELRALAGMVDRHLAAYVTALNADVLDVQSAWKRLWVSVHRTPRPHWHQRPWISIVAMAAVVCLIFGIGTGLRHDTSRGLPPLASSEPAPGKGAGVPPAETAPAGTSAARDKVDSPGSEVNGQREELYLMAENDLTVEGAPAAADSRPPGPGPARVQQPPAPSVPAQARWQAQDVSQTARAGNGAAGDKMHALSVPALTRDQVLGAKYVKDEEGVRPITPEELEQIVQWLVTARGESYSEEPPPLDELRIDLKDGRQIAIGAPYGETVLVSGLHGPGCLRLASPELVSFLNTLSGAAPAGGPSAAGGQQEPASPAPDMAPAPDAATGTDQDTVQPAE